MKKIDYSKHVWEGWTVGTFVGELQPSFDMIMAGESWRPKFQTRAEVKQWCMENQPYYKKYIPEVVDHFRSGMITTYTHKPFIGLESVTDPSGCTLFYDYDAQGRLRTVSNERFEPIKSYQYNYKLTQ